MGLLVLAVFGAVLLLAIATFSRANEVGAISVRDGRVLVIRGHVPDRLLSDLADVVKRARVKRAELSIVKSGGAPRLVASGVDDAIGQRLRNVLGAYPHRLTLDGSGPRRPRNLGQRLGVGWLAWLLHDRER